MARRRYRGGEGINLTKYGVTGDTKTAAEKTYDESARGSFDTSIATGVNLPASFRGLFDTSKTTGVNKSPPPITKEGALKYLGKAGKKSQRRKSKKRLTRRR